MSRVALATLQKEFPFGVQLADGALPESGFKFAFFWCTEKPHSMVHWARISDLRTTFKIFSSKL